VPRFRIRTISGGSRSLGRFLGPIRLLFPKAPWMSALGCYQKLTTDILCCVLCFDGRADKLSHNDQPMAMAVPNANRPMHTVVDDGLLISESDGRRHFSGHPRLGGANRS
jgi:hypothetical protein